MGDDDRVDREAMVLKGLQASTPTVFHRWFSNYPRWFLRFKLNPCYAASLAKYQSRSVYLKRLILNRYFVVEDKSVCISNSTDQVRVLRCCLKY